MDRATPWGAPLTPADPLLPSAAYRRHLGTRARRVVTDASPEVARTIEAVLGELGLRLATRPLESWAFEVADMVEALSLGRIPGEVGACLEVGERHGLLRRTPGDLLVPDNPNELLWLAARRTVDTEDAAGLMEHRLRGALADVFALVVAEQADPDAGRGMAAHLADSPGPLEEDLELSWRLVAAAGAWGGALDAPLRSRLIPMAFAWTSAPGRDPHRHAGAAFLATEVRGDHAGKHSFSQEIRTAATERVTQLLGYLDDPDLADAHDAFLEALEDTLTPLVAGSPPNTLEDLTRRLATRGACVGRVVGRLRPPGPDRDELLIRLARGATECGDDTGLGVLQAIQDALTVPPAMLHDALTRALKEPTDEAASGRAWGACQAVAAWSECSELTAHLLGRLAIAPVAPELRMAAAAALGSQGRWRTAMRDVVVAGLEGDLMVDDSRRRVGAVGAALWLGSPDPDLAAAALQLVLEGQPPELLAPGLAHALRLEPGLVDPLVAAGSAQGDAQVALVALLAGLTPAAQADAALGPFLSVPALTRGVRVGLTTVLLDAMRDIDDPDAAGAAAVLAGWLCRGHEELANLMFDLRAQADRAPLHGWLDIALGACGVNDPQVQALLAGDAAMGEPELACDAAIGLSALFDTARDIDGDALDPHVPGMAHRVAEAGPEAEPLRQALVTLSTLPLGG